MFVENQPINKAITFENHVPLGDQEVELASNKYLYDFSYHRLQGFLVPIANNESSLISFGLGYATDRYSSFPIQIEDKNEVIWFQLFGTGSIGDEYFWRSASAWGSYSTKLELKKSEAYKFTQILQVGRKWNTNLATSLGVIVLSNFGDTQFIPFAQITYSSGPWVADFNIPTDLSVRYTVNENLYFLIQNKINSRSYYYNTSAFRYSNLEVSLRSEIRIIGVLWGELAVSQPYAVKFEEQNGSNYYEFASSTKNPIMLNAGLFVRFKSK